MDKLQYNKAKIHESFVNMDNAEKATLVAQCTMHGIEVEELENTAAQLITGVQKVFGGLLEKNSQYLSK